MMVTLNFLMIANQPLCSFKSPQHKGFFLTFYIKKLICMNSFVLTIHIHVALFLAMIDSKWKNIKNHAVLNRYWMKNKCLSIVLTFIAISLFSTLPLQAFAWGNHSTASYRALENLPEISSADLVEAQNLDIFLKSQETAIAKLLSKNEQWAQDNFKYYPRLPSSLRFQAGSYKTDAQRRQAFITALRLAADTKFSLYIQVDPKNPNTLESTPIPPEQVSNYIHQRNISPSSLLSVKSGQKLSALSVIASATEEPDLGFDMNLWEDSPSPWGKIYGFGNQPFTTTQGYNASQAAFHSAFFYETKLTYLTYPQIVETYPLIRIHQFSTLAELAFNTGHDYWGWRFLGHGLHYLQDLTQPYHSSFTPGETSAYVAGLHFLDSIGMSQQKNDQFLRISNRHLMLERYQSQLIQKTPNKRYDSIAEVALKNTLLEDRLPKWTVMYAKNIVAKEASLFSERLADTLEQTLPERFLNESFFDFNHLKPDFDLMMLVAQSGPEKQLELEGSIARLMEQFGIHSRNMVRTVISQVATNATNNNTTINNNYSSNNVGLRTELPVASNGGLGLVSKSRKKDQLKLNAN